MRHHNKDDEPDDRHPWIGNKFIENLGKIMGSLTGKLVGKSKHGIFDGPSCHYAIVAHDEEARKHAQASHPLPLSAGSQFLIGTGCICLRVTSNHEFAQHDWQSDEKDTCDVDDDESSTTISSRFDRETPNIAQSNGRTRCRQHCTYFTTEIFSICHSFLLREDVF